MAQDPAQETPNPACSDIKNTCQDALDAADRVISQYEAGLKAADGQIESLNSRVAELEVQKLKIEQQKSAWYRNPFLYLTLGAVLGAAVTSHK